MHCARPSPAVMIKQEPRADAEVQAHVFHVPWIDDELIASDALLWPFVNLVDDETMGDTTAWSARHQDDAREDSWVSLLCHEDASVLDAGIMSPVATSDVVRFPQAALDKPVSPRWTAARLDDTMGPSIAAAVLEKTCTSHGCYERAVNEETGRCARHAGGRLCKVAGCTKNTQSHGLCIRHGGGRRCQVEGCPRGAQARGKCKTHGGGVRCKAPDCWRSSQGSGLCRTHGGGKLCDYPGCKKGTQRHGKCSTHGIVRRCQVAGCDKMDRGGGLCRRHMTEAKASGSESSAEDTDAGAVV